MIKLATLGIPALLAIIMHTPQSASGNWIGGLIALGNRDVLVDGIMQ